MSEPSVRRSRPPTIARRRAKVLAGLATQARKPRMGASPLAESEGGETGDQCGRPTQGLQGGGLAIDIPARGFPEVPAAAARADKSPGFRVLRRSATFRSRNNCVLKQPISLGVLPPMPVSSPGPTSRIFFSQRLRLHYVDWGNAEAPPLLMVHGGRDHCRNWDWLAVKLGGVGH